MAAIDERAGKIHTPEIRLLKEVRTGYTHFKNNDVLFAKITPCMENGKAAIARNLKNNLGCGSTEFFVLRPHKKLLPEFLFRFLRQEAFRNVAKQEMTGTSGHQRVPREFLESVQIPIPPLETQRQIAAKLDLLSSHTRHAQDYLSTIPTLAERFRQSILARAFTGELTADWRKNNPDVEPASGLLARIKVERRQKWIDTYARNLADRARKSAEKKGTPFSDADWQAYYDKKLKAGEKKYEEPQPVDAEKEGLPEIPESWEWVKLDLIASFDSGYAFKSNDYCKDGVPLVRIGDLQNDRINISASTASIPKEIAETQSHYLLNRGDILIALSGATTGKIGVYQDDSIAILNQRVGRVRTFGDHLTLQNLLFRFLQKSGARIYKEAWGGAQPNISPSTIADFPFPLPPTQEQHEIVRRISDLLNLLTTFETQAHNATQQLDRLNSSTLSALLSGK